MDRLNLGHVRLRPANRWRSLPFLMGKVGGALLLIATLLAAARFWFPGLGGTDTAWPEALVLLLSAAASVGTQARHLPLPNVLLAATLAVGLVAGAILLNAATGIPFGAGSDDPLAARRLLLTWPLASLAFLFTSRGVARFVLRPWRQTHNYGFRVLGLTVLLALLLELHFEPFATTLKHYWSWKPTRLGLGWYGTSFLVIWSWGVLAFISAVVMAPFLINKSPAPGKPDSAPLWVWLCLKGLFLAGAVRGGLWMAAGLTLFELVALAGFAVWLARSAGSRRD
jgi:hypothetical protein